MVLLLLFTNIFYLFLEIDLRTKVKGEATSTEKNISSYIHQRQQSFTSPPLVPNLSGMLLEFYQKNRLNVPKKDKAASYEKVSALESKTECNLSSSGEKSLSLPTLYTKSSSTRNLQEIDDDKDLSINKDSSVEFSNNTTGKKLSVPFHPRIKYSNINKPASTIASSSSVNLEKLNAVPAPVIQGPVISSAPTAAAIAAAAFFRGEYRNFQQLQSQEVLSHQPSPMHTTSSTTDKNVPFYFPAYLKNTNNTDKDSENDDQSRSEDVSDEEDEEEPKYPCIDDIHLIEGSKSSFHNQNIAGIESDYMSEESQKYSMIAAQALRNLEYSLSDYGGNMTEEQLYNCRHCGKKYRWKSTLRRHENVECGGKEPSHQCPYCPYKSKQRGNLGVHVRKHHANLPQLASKRRSKYSQPRE